MNMKTIIEPDVLYVVLEEDRGCGVSVQGVFSNIENAEVLASTSSRYFIDISYVNKIDV